MEQMKHHLNTLKSQPSHVRERVAVGVSGGITALVAVGWFAAMATSGSFSLATKSVAESVRPPQEVTQGVAASSGTFKSLMGAAGEALGGKGANTPAISVVETRSSTSLDAGTRPDATVIPF
jgi:hypothetical protein